MATTTRNATVEVTAAADTAQPAANVESSKTLNERGNANGLFVPTGRVLLPTRPAKLLAPTLADLTWIPVQSGKDGILRRTITPRDFAQTQVRDPKLYAAGLSDYIYIELQGRGADGGPLRKSFLVNPESISAHYDVRDSEALGRGGWMVGVWGEMGTVSISGWTAGRYFAGRLVDTASVFTPSYRDLLDLVAVYENNGVFYEGEAASNGIVPLAAARKQIQSHADVTLKFGNFIWDGYFTDLKVDDAADKPYLSKFTMGFQVLRERYASTSPWRNSITPEVQYRGHAYELTSALVNSGRRTAASMQASRLMQQNLNLTTAPTSAEPIPEGPVS